VEPWIVVRWHLNSDDPSYTGVGFNPGVVTDIGHDVRASTGDSEVAGKNLGMVELVDGGRVEQMDSEAVVRLTQNIGCAVVPPKRERAANKAGVESANPATKE